MSEKEEQIYLDEFLSTEDVLREFKISKRAQNELRHKRSISFTKAGGKAIYRRRWVLDYLSAKTVKATQ